MIEKPIYRYGSLDSGSVCKLFREPTVFIPAADDYTKPEHIQSFIDLALANPQMYVLGRNPRAEAFIFAPSHNATTFQAHFAVRKDHRDGTVVKRVAEAGKWIFEHTTCQSVIAFMQEENKGGRSVLAQLGMKKIGKIEKSVKFNGELRDELIYYGTVADYNALWAEELGGIGLDNVEPLDRR